MMIGEFTDIEPVRGVAIQFRKGSTFSNYLPEGQHGNRVFVVRTFVGQHLLRPEQATAMAMVDRWAEAHTTPMLPWNTLFSQQHAGGFEGLMTAASAEEAHQLVNDDTYQAGVFSRTSTTSGWRSVAGVLRM